MDQFRAEVFDQYGEQTSRPCDSCEYFYMTVHHMGCKHKNNLTKKMLSKNSYICHFLLKERLDRIEKNISTILLNQKIKDGVY